MKLPQMKLPQVKLPGRKSKLQSFLDTVGDSMDGAADNIWNALPNAGAASALKASVSRDSVLKAGVIAGGVVGLTAGSAGISSLRRRTEGERDHS